MKNIEVEFRAHLDDHKYNEMINYFSANGSLILDGERETTKFGPHDVRIREDWKGSILMLKVGDVNNIEREEYEVKIDNVAGMKKIISSLGLNYIHSWKTLRKKYDYNGFTVCIDDIPGFMKTLEIEKKCSISEVEEVKKEISSLFDSLGLSLIDPKWFKEEIEKYNEEFHSGKINC